MQKDDATWLNVAYIIGGVLGLYVFYQMFETVAIQADFIDSFRWFQPVNILVSAALSFLVVYFYCKKPERREYHLSSIAELRKVTWPTSEIVSRLTLIVVVFSCIFALLLALFDSVWSKLLELIIA